MAFDGSRFRILCCNLNIFCPYVFGNSSKSSIYYENYHNRIILLFLQLMCEFSTFAFCISLSVSVCWNVLKTYFVIITQFRFVPESPRWLLIVKKEKEAEIILNKIAEVNKRDFNCKPEDIEIPVVENRTVRLWKIFSNPQLRKRTILLLFNWYE